MIAAEHADVERCQHRDRARRQRVFELARARKHTSRDHQQRHEDAHLDRDRLEDEGGDDEQHHRDAERDRDVVALLLAEVEELVEGERGAERRSRRRRRTDAPSRRARWPAARR